MQVLTCGHSLGGAVATLAAMDIVHACNVSATNISCYTFGCPRVGNHAFADAYAAAVPDTWHVINGQDVVVHSMKFWGWYKRNGNRVRARHSLCNVSENLRLSCLTLCATCGREHEGTCALKHRMLSR